MTRLESLAPCFQGLIPATLFTCSRKGIPNAAFLSHVDYVDPEHVALSFQFFNKSKANISENPHALVRLIDPDTSQGWALRLRYVRSETSGPVFERMALRIEAIASYSGLKGIFKLLAADIYHVEAVDAADDEGPRATPATRAPSQTADPVFTVQALQGLAARIHRAESLDTLLDSILEGLEESFGFSHSMILVPGAEERLLVALASRGYPETGVGAEVRVGEGICGMVAEARKPIRISGLIRQMLYAYAVRKRASEQGLCPPDRQIALPGLASPDSQLGVPLLNRGELIGVLCIESELPYRFHEEDKTAVELLGSYLAIAIHSMLLQERSEPPDAGAAAPRASEAATAPPQPGRPTHEVAYYRADECILVDGEYLIRSLPARILWKLLSARQSERRAEFTNRELRLDKSLNLPEWKDNLESRLLLLRRRLEQKCPDLRLVPRGRGRFALEVASDLVLVEKS
ncbi:MAG TPA: GAF domain-containing protein [Vicinamibacterales bacterium]|nr:GAF domain-containing protein [Vicinamibacterales bacterium]